MKFLVFIVFNIFSISCRSHTSLCNGTLPLQHSSACKRNEPNVDTLVKQIEDFEKETPSLFEILNTMKEAGTQTSTPTLDVKLTIGSKLTAIKEKVKKLEHSLVHTTAGSLADVFVGLPALLNGIDTQDIYTALSGGLSILSGLANFLGPLGSVASVVLSLISSIFSWFGGSASIPKESEEIMIKRVIETAIEENEIRLLKEEIAGVRNVYTVLSNSLNNFREQTIVPLTNEEVQKKISDLQGVQFFNQAFQELVPFGKLKEAINKYCAAGFLQSNSDNKEVVIGKAKTCAAFVRLYCDLAIRRHLLLVDMAAVVNHAGTSILNQTGQNFLYMLNKEIEIDQEFLRFLIDPINYPDRRYAVAYFFDTPSSNKLAERYLKTVYKRSPTFYEPGVMACKNFQLQGRCVSFERNPYFQGERFHSIFVPPGKSINGLNIHSKRRGILLNNKVIHYLGPFVYNVVLGGDKQGGMNIAELVVNSERTSTNEAKLCEVKTDNGINHHKCDSIQKDIRYTKGIGSGLAHERLTISTISVVTIPAKMKLIVKDSSSVLVGEYYGPDVISNVCSGTRWIEITMVEIENGRKIVKFCSENNLGGACYRKPVPALGEDNMIRIEQNGFGNCAITKINSMEIPKSIQVSLRQSKTTYNERSGPFVGPAVISKIMSDRADFIKIIDRSQPSIEICKELYLMGKCVQLPVENYDGGMQIKSAWIPPGVNITFFAQRNMGGKGIKPDAGIWNPEEFKMSFKIFK